MSKNQSQIPNHTTSQIASANVLYEKSKRRIRLQTIKQNAARKIFETYSKTS